MVLSTSDTVLELIITDVVVVLPIGNETATSPEASNFKRVSPFTLSYSTNSDLVQDTKVAVKIMIAIIFFIFIVLNGSQISGIHN